jgi:hypothetical protein
MDHKTTVYTHARILCFLVLGGIWSCSSVNDAQAPHDGGLGEHTVGLDHGSTALDCPGCTVLVGARVFDGKQIQPATVAIRGDRIHRVLPAGAAVSAGQIVELDGCFRTSPIS